MIQEKWLENGAAGKKQLNWGKKNSGPNLYKRIDFCLSLKDVICSVALC